MHRLSGIRTILTGNGITARRSLHDSLPLQLSSTPNRMKIKQKSQYIISLIHTVTHNGALIRLSETRQVDD